MIEVKFTANSPEHFREILMGLLAEAPVAEAPVAEAPVAEVPVAEAPVATTPVAEAPVATTPVAEAPPAADKPSSITLADLRAAMAAKVQEGKREEVQACIGQAQPGAEKLSDVDDANRPALMALVEAL